MFIVKLNEECPSEDSCMNENAACLPHGAVNICQCADGYVDDNGNENGGICIPSKCSTFIIRYPGF